MRISPPKDSVNETQQALVNQVNTAAKSVNKKIKRRFFRSKKRVIRYGLVIINVALFFGVASFIIATRSNTADSKAPTFLASTVEDKVTDPLDTISGADIAVNIAKLARLDEVTAVTNNADSVNTQLGTMPSDTQVVAKSQIVRTNLKSVSDIVAYTAVEGDTVSGLAKRYGVTADSIRWSNSLSGDSITVGKSLTIPPVNGFVYVVKDGDTTESLASRFSSTEAKIVAFNDVELTGLVVGESVVIPDGKKPAPTQPVYNRIRPAVYGFNGYDYGYCTYYVAGRVSVPTSWGNAKWWDDNASRTPGWGVIYSPGVGEVPAGAIMVSNSGYYGHVAYVESVSADGSLYISEMNANWNWNVTSSRTIPADRIGAYNYVVRY